MLSGNRTMDKHAHIVRGIFPPPRLFPCDRTHLSSIISASPTSRLYEINRISRRCRATKRLAYFRVATHVSFHSCASPSVKTFGFGKNSEERTLARKINNMQRGKRTKFTKQCDEKFAEFK